MRVIYHLLIIALTIFCGSVNGQTTISGATISGARLGFFPDSISGLSFWVDASVGTTIDTTAGVNTVSQWNDLSGNGNHATQATKANQPLYIENNLHGHPILRFTGTPVFMSANGVASFLTGNDTPHTSFVVVKVNVLSAGFSWAASSVATGTPVIRSAPVNAAANFIYTRVDDGATSDAKTLAGGAVSTWYITSVAFAGSAMTIARNATIDTGTVNVGAITLDTYSIGAKNGGGVMSGFLNADIAEVIVYNRNLTALEILRVTTYLNNKYRVF